MIKVLIIDDSVFMRTIIRDMLQKDALIEIVGTATNGIEALEKISLLHPDLITLDIEMPKMNGLEVLERLPANHPLSKNPDPELAHIERCRDDRRSHPARCG